MASPDRQEIVFAGAGILWGVITFYRGLCLWRGGSAGRIAQKKSALTMSLIGGFALIIGCSAYLVWSLRDAFQ